MYIKTIYVLNGCETWSVAVREEYMLWLFDSRELSRRYLDRRGKG
jgi:hypothetical protein